MAWDAHLNRLNVVKLDMTGIIELTGSADVVPTLREVLLAELREEWRRRLRQRKLADPDKPKDGGATGSW